MTEPVLTFSQRLAPRDVALREFHVSRESRDRYEFEESLFSLSGNVIFMNFRAARTFAQRMNEKRDVVSHPERSVRAGELNAMGLVDEILHYIVAQYREQRNPDVLREALAYLEDRLGESRVDEMLRAFVTQFPPVAVYRGDISAEDYLRGESEGVSHRAVALEELLMLWLANENPASEPFMELFDDEALEETTAYPDAIDQLEDFFEAQPTFGPDNQSLFEMLRAPSRTAPRSWYDQLAFMRDRWRDILGKYLFRLLSSLDFLEEEAKMFIGFGPGPAEVYEFGELEAEPENFSPDQDWMPRVVMIAKNVYVWLSQLSESYGRDIQRLDQIPDGELARLQRYGFTALWLIGLWERSDASKRIKQMMGNPEAVASAYSLKTYTISGDLGGEEAFEDLKARAWKRGIRMASDMVPNHMGIDSDWMFHHPDWFVSLDYSPFPTYSFNGPDLTDDERVGVYLEDHYYERSDASVVFKRVDHWTGDERFIYHGNDGTQMPWNDTAQLDYLKAEVREAVIQTILNVARRSPIIRFDAAMTLTKKHYQRLWFPEPGSGGDIPSRADFGMTKEQFDEMMPEEFWRQVVNRVAEEVPDTLLLAEAFWLMEGYFVRSLGMHRVYNSAFMNMMRDEKNAEYREVMKNTLEFDPEILRRYVNFMNNPDERTAVDQFGKGDKYFGICTVMMTVPGLPMFGHGQIEGYAEKYGMEFQKAYWDENPDPYLVERHEREIFPIAHRRSIFAGVENFFLYDFVTAGGSVDENVFAYSNRSGDERALVLYHNRFGDTRGWVRTSVAYAAKDGEGNKSLVNKSLAEGLDIPNDPQRYVIFRDVAHDLEYIRNCRKVAEEGLYAALNAYQVHVFMEFRLVEDDASRQYEQLTADLNGQGVPSIEKALFERYLKPVTEPLTMLVSGPAFRWIADYAVEDATGVDVQFLDEIEEKVCAVLSGIVYLLPEERTAAGAPKAEIAAYVRRQLALALSLPVPAPLSEPVEDYLRRGWDTEDWTLWGALLGWLFTHRLGYLVDAQHGDEVSRSWFEEWMLNRPLQRALEGLELEEEQVEEAVTTSRMLLSYPTWFPAPEEIVEGQGLDPYATLLRALGHEDVQAYLHVNRYQGNLWFHKESMATWRWWLLCRTLLVAGMVPDVDVAAVLDEVYRLVVLLEQAVAASDYQVEKLLDALKTGED